jgi:prevent-host-death family protein
MGKSVNIHEAKTHLSRLVDEAAAGREVIIARAGKPVARLVALADVVKPKKLGLLKGKMKVPDDFNAPLPPAVLALFEGK